MYNTSPYVTAISGTYGGGKSKKSKAQSLEHKGNSISERLNIVAKEEILMNCPACGSKATGRVGVDQYYCWDCCVEYKMRKNEVNIYEVAEDGTLMVIGDQDNM